MLALVWLISLAISSPIALGMNYTERRAETPQLCIFYNSDFIIYSSMGSFYIPCVVMVLLYWRIFKAIRDRARKSARKKAKPKANEHGEENKKLVANVIENKAHCASMLAGSSAGGNGAVRQTTSDASATEGDNSQRELLPTNSLKAALPNAIIEETSFTNFNAGAVNLTTDTEDNQQKPADFEQLEEVDTDHVIQNNKTMTTTSDEGGDHVTKVGYSGPSCVQIAPVENKNKVLLSPPPPRRNMRLGLISVFTPNKHMTNSHCNSSSTHNGGDNGDSVQPSPNKKSVTKFNFHLRHSKKKKEKLSSRRERKATKTLAIVLGK